VLLQFQAAAAPVAPVTVDPCSMTTCPNWEPTQAERDQQKHSTQWMIRGGLFLGQGPWAGSDQSVENGRPPRWTPRETVGANSGSPKQPGYHPLTMPTTTPSPPPPETASLWVPGSRTFLDQRASKVGDLITIVVNMNDAANWQNNSTGTRTSNELAGMTNLFGLENQLARIPTNPKSPINLNSNNANTGTGQIQRNETVTLTLAGVVTQVLPNGNLVVVARQQFRVNSELRVLTAGGVIRRDDIASDNTIQLARMAEARISYGGRGQLTDVQTPRWGQQVMDAVLPF
jgi:flagellar L-ring protein FlgH